jgi:uncharacterized protein (DUF1778 family)
MATAQRKGDRLEFRASARQVALLRAAAATSGRSVTDFVLDSATERAAEVLTDQRLFVLDDEAWRRFNAALETPAEPVPALVEFFRREAESGSLPPATTK